MYGRQYDSGGLPLLSADPNVEGMFGEFPADGQDQLPDPVLSSDSSAEDDLTLGPDPDSADHGASGTSVYASSSQMGSQHSSPHSTQTPQMIHNLMPQQHGQPPHILSTAMYGQIPHAGYHSGASLQHGMSNGNIAGGNNGARVQMMMTESHYGYPPSQPHMMHSYASHMNLNHSVDLPPPSARSKRGSVDQLSPGRYPSHSPHGPQSSSQSYASSSPPSSQPSTPSRRRSTSTRAASLDSTNAPGTPGSTSSDGYFYRSRDKTNYQQAHKGVMPNPPTPEGSKRIRCTWTLEETRRLYDILKDTTVDNFPDAQTVFELLHKIDLTSNKSLEHVRNKKANLLQKAHSRACTVAEVLIADMNKLENEATGSNRATAALAQARDRELSLLAASAHLPAPTSTSSSPSLSTATSISSSSNGSGVKTDFHRSDTDIKVGATNAEGGGRGSRAKASGAATSRSRRRGGKRSATNSYNPSMIPVPTSTAQQLANLSRASLDLGSTQGSNASPPSGSPASESAMRAPDSLLTLSSSLASGNDIVHTTPRVTLTAGPPPSDFGGISIGALPQHMDHTSSHQATGSLTLLTPPRNEDLSAEHNASVSKTIAQETSSAVIANSLTGNRLTPDLNWQNWVRDCMKAIFQSTNEIREQLRLEKVEMPTPPPNTTASSLPPNEQWISSWNATTTSTVSPIPSLLSPTPLASLSAPSLTISPHDLDARTSPAPIAISSSPAPTTKFPSLKIDEKSATADSAPQDLKNASKMDTDSVRVTESDDATTEEKSQSASTEAKAE